MSTLSLWPKEGVSLPLPLLAAILNSAFVRAAYASAFAPLALRGGNTQVTRQKLVAVEVPERWLKVQGPDAPPNDERQSKALDELMDVLPAHSVALTKLLPSEEEISLLLSGASALRASFGASEAQDHAPGILELALLKLATESPLHAGERGWLDLLLLAIAMDGAAL